ncbi:hypothetical protein HQ545_02980 [Candidatus Woesearchaeota archaeon]|nr:hypothetical protein [Candidatus Woesearchaeota archaeon]
MFEEGSKIKFREDHIINPERTEFVTKKSGKRRRKLIGCITCSTSNPKRFENRYDGVYASALEFFCSNDYLKQLHSNGVESPKVVSVRIRTKEPASEAEKIAYRLSAKRAGKSVHLKTIKENRVQLEERLDGETVKLLMADKGRAIYDKFGIRVVTRDEMSCYDIFDWFSQQYETKRIRDRIKKPKKNGYQSIHARLLGMHTDGMSGLKTSLDLQVRSVEMDLEAEKGSAARSPEKDRKELVDRKLFLAVTAFRHYLFGV